MAFCPNCNSDRPITRQTYVGQCRFCGRSGEHLASCRGPVKGAFDVCSYCNEPLFARVATAQALEIAIVAEAEGVAAMAPSDAEQARLAAEDQKKAEANACGWLIVGPFVVIVFVAILIYELSN